MSSKIRKAAEEEAEEAVDVTGGEPLKPLGLHAKTLTGIRPLSKHLPGFLSLQQNDGCPTSRSFFARCGIPRILTLCVDREVKSFGSRTVVSHISRKASEIWGTRP